MPGDSMLLLIGFCLRATVVLAVAWALTAAMRRASASTRHFVWTCAIVGAALVPIASVAAPHWQVPAPAALASLSSMVAPEVTTPAIPPRQAAAPVAQATPGAAPAVHAAPAVSARSADRDYTGMALSAWAAGTIATLIYMLAGAAAAWRIRRSTAPLDVPWIEEAHVLAEALDIRPQVAFVESASTTMPMVCGVWRPAVVLPRGAAEWPSQRLRVVLLHELAHVRRRDCLTQALAQIVCAAYWFNPLVWIAARRLRDERERACDDFVLAAGTRGSEYAGHLLEIARTMGRARFSPLASTGLAMAHRSQLEGRLMAILDPATRRSSAFYTRVAAVAAVLLVSIPVAAVQLRTPARDTRDIPLAPSAMPAAPQPDTPEPVAPPAAAQAGDAAPVFILSNVPEQNWQFYLQETQNSLRLLAEETGGLSAEQNVPPVRAQVPGQAFRPLRQGRVLDRALVEAAEEGDVEAIAALIAARVSPNAQVAGDGSALIAAARSGNPDVVRLLLDYGADPNLAVSGDGNPLIAAAGRGHIAVVQLLLERGAAIDQIVPGDENALITASAAGQLEMVRLLVSRGADVNARVWVDEIIARDSVVFDASGRRRVVPSRSFDGEWRSALSVARRAGHDAVVQYLLSAGAQE